jgi:hypothetical protein
MNKILEVTGTIEEVSINETEDTYQVRLAGGRRRGSLTCEFAKDPAVRAQLTQLQRGTQVRIRGKYTGDLDMEGCMIPK